MATMRDIKRRKSSIESTEQITKAMKLVATVKLQKSRTKAENSRLYFNLMYQTIQEMLKKSTGIRHRYLKSGDSKKKAVIVVSSNRGLAGGYNSNIIRLVTESGIPKRTPSSSRSDGKDATDSQGKAMRSKRITPM